MIISEVSLNSIDPNLSCLFKSSDSFIAIGKAMIQAGTNIAALEDQFQEGMTRGRPRASIELEAQQLFFDELMEPVSHIFESLACLCEDLQLTD